MTEPAQAVQRRRWLFRRQGLEAPTVAESYLILRLLVLQAENLRYGRLESLRSGRGQRQTHSF